MNVHYQVKVRLSIDLAASHFRNLVVITKILKYIRSLTKLVSSNQKRWVGMLHAWDEKSWKYVGCKTWTNWRTTSIKGGILEIILHKLCGTVWTGFIWFRREKDVGSNMIMNIKFQWRQLTSPAAKGWQLLMKVWRCNIINNVWPM